MELDGTAGGWGVRRATVRNAKEVAGYKQQLEEMLREGIIVEREEKQIKFLNHTFLLAKDENDFRFILNAKQLNKHLTIPHFKLESIGTVLDTIRRRDWLIKFDLKSAYSQVPVTAEAMNYLGFAYGGKTYVYRALPFGLATAPCLFTKIMKPVISRLREKYRCGIYLDDGIMMFATMGEAEAGVKEMLQLMSALGIRISFKKSELTPTQALEFLGWRIDTGRMEVAVVERKRAEAGRRVVAWIKRAKEKKQVKIRDFASISGLLSSMSLAIPQAHLRLRLCTEAIERNTKSQGWDGKMQLDESVVPGLEWWQQRLSTEIGMRLRPFVPDAQMSTDASRHGWGVALVHEGKENRVRGDWDARMAGKETSSNLRELTAVREGLVRLLREKVVEPGWDILVQSDNLTTVANINRRSCATSLVPEMTILFDLLEEQKLRLRVTYIPGKENIIADALSRQTDASDYAIDTEVFMSLTEELGVSVGIDLFASPGNTKARRYYSWRPTEGALGSDALAQKWRDEEDMYAFPPTVLIPKILNKLQAEGGRMLIITPAWAAATWMRQLEDMTVRRRELGEILEFAHRGSLVPTKNSDPPGRWIASVIEG